MIKEIITEPLFLARTSEEVKNPMSEASVDIVKTLVQTAIHFTNHGRVGCAGLAAVQVGWLQRVFVMRFGDRFIPLTNPVLLEGSESRAVEIEGCLSRPGAKVRVSRHKRIKVQYFDVLTGKTVTRKFKGFDARVFQHELDHLNGVYIQEEK